MENFKQIPAAVASLIPATQLEFAQKNLWEYTRELKRIETALQKCPKLGETEGMKEHPAIFHYFFGSTDIYVCEYDPPSGQMFGYGILNGDLPNSEWGYFKLQRAKY